MLENMISEVELSIGVSKDFKSYTERSGAAEAVDISPNVLAKCDWLSSETVQFVPPNEVLSLQKNFESFYLSRSQNLGKSIDWVYHYGRVELKATFGIKSYFLVGKPYHYFLLSALESRGELGLEELKKTLGLKNVDNLLSILDTLVTTRLIILDRKEEAIGEKDEQGPTHVRNQS
jgi:hypothetical protein